MSVALANNQDAVQGSVDSSQNPILKGKHIKDGKEVIEGLIKDVAEEKAKIAEHLTQVMLQMKQSGLGDPLKNLSQNPSWLNFINDSGSDARPTKADDDKNMFMEIFKALNASSKASNMDLAGACRKLLSNNSMTSLIEKTAQSDLADTQKQLNDAYSKYEDAQSHESFWDKIMGWLAPVIAVVVMVVVMAVAVVVAPAIAPVALVGLGVATGLGSGIGLGISFRNQKMKEYTDDEAGAIGQSATATGDLSMKTTMNQNSISKVQLDTQTTSTLEENIENDKASIDSVKKSVVQAMTHIAASN